MLRSSPRSRTTKEESSSPLVVESGCATTTPNQKYRRRSSKAGSVHRKLHQHWCNSATAIACFLVFAAFGIFWFILQTVKPSFPFQTAHMATRLFPDLPLTTGSLWPDHRAIHDPQGTLHSCLPADGCGGNHTVATDITLLGTGHGVLDRVLETVVRTLVRDSSSSSSRIVVSSSGREEETHSIRLAVGPPLLQVLDWLWEDPMDDQSLSHAECNETLRLWWQWHCRIHEQYQRYHRPLLTIPLDILLAQPRSAERQLATFLQLPEYDVQHRYPTITGGKVDMSDAAAHVLDLVDRVSTMEHADLLATTAGTPSCHDQVQRPLTSERVQQLAHQLLVG